MDPAWGNWITVPRHLIHLKRPGHSSAAMSQTVSDSALRQPHGLSGLRAVLASQRIRLTDGQRRHTKPTLKPTSEPAWLAKSGLRHQEHSLGCNIRSQVGHPAHCLTDVKQTSQLHADAIRQVQCIYDTQLSHLFDLHRQVEDLDNRGCRHNIRVQGVPRG